VRVCVFEGEGGGDDTNGVLQADSDHIPCHACPRSPTSQPLSLRRPLGALARRLLALLLCILRRLLGRFALGLWLLGVPKHAGGAAHCCCWRACCGRLENEKKTREGVKNTRLERRRLTASSASAVSWTWAFNDLTTCRQGKGMAGRVWRGDTAARHTSSSRPIFPRPRPTVVLVGVFWCWLVWAEPSLPQNGAPAA
jgi:hypothetical protein